MSRATPEGVLCRSQWLQGCVHPEGAEPPTAAYYNLTRTHYKHARKSWGLSGSMLLAVAALHSIACRDNIILIPRKRTDVLPRMHDEHAGNAHRVPKAAPDNIILIPRKRTDVLLPRMHDEHARNAHRDPEGRCHARTWLPD
ncbi:hypothetical protein GGX14DRAFT_565137 [Mycena pura]|uniref:Uncharacterized protein n=1 Tax=Mycena pura TaxID=153505 RepID=A0AAD6VJC5_9AGAR|nr:hypothetical protein GGX14DRAFT_565137 [Mycena pura]